MSVNQCTPEISLPTTVIPMIVVHMILSALHRTSLFTYLQRSGTALPIITHTSIVCEDGKDASGWTLPGMMIGL